MTEQKTDTIWIKILSETFNGNSCVWEGSIDDDKDNIIMVKDLKPIIDNYQEDQANKVESLESELSRYKAALDTAKGALIGISMPEIQTEMFDSVRFAQIALELITQALEKEEK